jgi:hypothetical protein
MGFLESVEPGLVGADTATGLAFGIIKLLGYGAMGIVVVGALLSALCDLFECRKWRRARGRSESWHLMP